MGHYDPARKRATFDAMAGSKLTRRGLLAGSLPAALAGSQETPEHPNILHIMTDQQQWATAGPLRVPHAEPESPGP